MNTDEFIKILEKYASGHATEEEREIVDAYFEKQQLASDLTPLSLAETKSNLYRRIEGEMKKVKPIGPSYRYFYSIGIAASILLVLGLFMFLGYESGPQMRTVQTRYGEKQEVLLPDGTFVMLNSGSAIQFPGEFEEGLREVVLEGEAFFRVYRDTSRPFRVKTQELTTEVLGTSFNINSFPDKDSITVSVATGKVMVKNSDGLREILLPNHQLHYDKATYAYRKSANESAIDAAWASNTIYLNNIRLEEAIHMLEKWFDVSIHLSDPSLADRKVIGKYHNPDLRQTMESLSFLLGIEFKEKSPSTYTVIPKTRLPM
ncbi:FecR family protein [Zobellia uliginosa]|uniref:FecR family protein n=1 Tax=Zobellia uliginosa TaxID=143224 RepID=UPI0026E34BEB|nr:FecR domain-containing protein [Zobellia uliginosa]MDO6518117.1 FecR domain-containing protein [Zobellia uliginosa]